MKFVAGDFQKIRNSALAFLALVAVGATPLVLASLSIKTARQTLQSEQARRQEIDRELGSVKAEAATIDETTRHLQRLLTRDLLGEERRLEWIEQLKVSREKFRIIDLHYELSPQQAVAGETGGDFTFFVSPMQIQIDLLHEEDLIGFLDDLRAQTKALPLIRSCQLKRQSNTHAPLSPEAKLRAECRVDWITLRKTQGEKLISKGKP